MNRLSKDSASWHEIDENAHDQRIDNYLHRLLKGVPKTHIYRILRSGEVRVNSGRVEASYRLQSGDRVRIPPVATSRAGVSTAGPAPRPKLKPHVLFEDEHLLVLNKPAGRAVHGGSGISLGIVEQLRLERPEAKFLELVHRLDRDTSGVLLLAKKRSALTALHADLREGRVRKYYSVLVHGAWRAARQDVRLALDKHVLASGERRVSVSEQGQTAHTVFRLAERRGNFSLLDAELKTGRTHQIRVHLAHLGFPIAGDDKYGDFALNRQLISVGLKRMFLHAARVVLKHPATGLATDFHAPLPPELGQFLARAADLDVTATV
jgi:23S rRNA pseudouridine955/2504/2580 synthase